MVNDKFMSRLLFLIFLFGCTSVEFDFPLTDITISRSHQLQLDDGKSIFLHANSTEAIGIVNWLNKSDNKWVSSPASYISGYRFDIDKYHFNILEKAIVLNYINDSGDSKQFTCEIKDSTFDFLDERFNDGN